MEGKKSYGRTLSGELITDELIEKIVQEAEKGWEIEELLTWRDLNLESEPTQGDSLGSSERLPRRRQ